MRLKSLCGGLFCGGLFLLANELTADDARPFVVHEWGTFTALMSEDGEQLKGINVDTEPVPRFVHNLGRFLLNEAILSSQHWIHRQKAVPRNHPAVTLRLETPVIYFYPATGSKLPMTVDVDVKFRGGWLTEFYPRAEVKFPVVENGEFEFSDLTSQTIGNIVWRNLQIGTDAPGPETNEHVWLAPRNVAAANVTSALGENEKYLFYRGVAQQRSPLVVVTNKLNDTIQLFPTFSDILSSNQKEVLRDLWLMETRADGACAYRRLDPITVTKNGNPSRGIVAERRFSEPEFDSGNRAKLETEMNEALLREGLYVDEAKALLSTWQQAYFTSPGLRVFYAVPRVWTDYYLPITISGKPQITRVMIGRVELMSDLQRELLDRLAKVEISSGAWLEKIRFDSPELRKLLSGHSDFGDLGVPIPEDFQLYLKLGRFRNALIAAEERNTRSANLSRFIQENQLDPFRLAQRSGK